MSTDFSNSPPDSTVKKSGTMSFSSLHRSRTLYIVNYKDTRPLPLTTFYSLSVIPGNGVSALKYAE